MTSMTPRAGSLGRSGVLLLLAVALCGGCVRRTLTITSEPEGALVLLNDREVGRTPVEVEFTYYGVYDVRLVREGWEPFVGSATASAPVWDTIPLDFFSELTPADLHSRVAWHFILAPAQDAGLMERADAMRAEVASEPPPAAGDADESGESESGGESPPLH